jgi:hypothetical protein
LVFDFGVDAADVNARVLDVTEFPECKRSRLVTGQAITDQRVGAGIDVELQLGVDVAANHRARSAPELKEARAHAGSSTRNTAAA